jgi:hypothetical protein
MKLHRWLCVLACFPVVNSDQLQALVTCSRAARRFEGSASMGGFVMLSLATDWLGGLRGVLVREVLLCYHLQQSDCRV